MPPADGVSGFPDQEPDELRATVDTATRLPLTHLSLYSFRPTPGTFMRRKLAVPEKSAYLRRQQLLFTDARRRIEDAGLAEYASGYFGRVSPFAAMYFQLRADTIGFGSGAVSLTDQRFLSHQKGRLHQYVEDPLAFDIAVLARPAIEPLTRLLRRRGLVEDDRGVRLDRRVAGLTLVELAFEMAMSQPDLA